MIFDFNTTVIERSRTIPVLVEFSSPGCGPCVWMEKTLIELTREMSGKIEFVSLPIMKDLSLIDRFQIKSNPTTVLFVNGRDVARLKGALPKMVVEQWVNDFIGESK